jgi:hypothetical protein
VHRQFTDLKGRFHSEVVQLFGRLIMQVKPSQIQQGARCRESFQFNLTKTPFAETAFRFGASLLTRFIFQKNNHVSISILWRFRTPCSPAKSRRRRQQSGEHEYDWL